VRARSSSQLGRSRLEDMGDGEMGGPVTQNPMQNPSVECAL
jgi:hypothetical protein